MSPFPLAGIVWQVVLSPGTLIVGNHYLLRVIALKGVLTPPPAAEIDIDAQ